MAFMNTGRAKFVNGDEFEFTVTVPYDYYDPWAHAECVRREIRKRYGDIEFQLVRLDSAIDIGRK